MHLIRYLAAILVLGPLIIQGRPVDLSQNAIYITDMPTSRLIRMRDFTAAGWEEGPTNRQSLNWPWHFTFDANGRLYIADRDNGRIVRMDDLTGTGWKTFSGIGTNILAPPPRTSGTSESGNFVSSVFVDSAGRIYATTSFGSGRLVRIDDMDGNGWTTFSQNTGGLESVVVNRQGRIYFSDNTRHWIVRMNDMPRDRSRDARIAGKRRQSVQRA